MAHLPDWLGFGTGVTSPGLQLENIYLLFPYICWSLRLIQDASMGPFSVQPLG